MVFPGKKNYISSVMTTSPKKRIAVVGTGGRSGMYTHSIYKTFTETTELVAVCDISRVRMAQRLKELRKETGYEGDIPMYHSDDFDRMLEEVKPDEVMVCTMDCTHDTYITRALRAGIPVSTEKPMTTEVGKCADILSAVDDSGQPLRVTFNYRWMPPNSKVRELIKSGVIGTVRHVAMTYALDTSHGADYFRRWHSEKDKSGGLLVHKSTHHFDLVNWWTDNIPERVYASGSLVFYGKDNALKRGDEQYTGYDRYTGTDSKHDPYRLDLTDHDATKGMYLDAEEETGYLRDRNVFREGIDIEDSMSVIVNYRNGMTLSYSLNAYSPIEGCRTVFYGDRGRIEWAHFGGSHLILGQSEEELAEMQNANKGVEELIVTPHFKPSEHLEVPHGKGGHGGGDIRILEQIMMSEPPEDPMNCSAGHEQGAASVMIGIAANQSMKSGQAVNISDLLPGFATGKTHLGELV